MKMAGWMVRRATPPEGRERECGVYSRSWAFGGRQPGATRRCGSPRSIGSGMLRQKAEPRQGGEMTGTQTRSDTGAGLTTTMAPFIEEAQSSGKLYIHQPYELYSEENHEAWRRLYARMEDRWRRYANERFMQGIDTLCLNPERVPRLEEVNRFMAPLTGFRAKAVSGYVPAYLFFDSLRNREFPTTITVRALDSLDYLPEPDIFHDVAGHVPMHTDPAFADA